MSDHHEEDQHLTPDVLADMTYDTSEVVDGVGLRVVGATWIFTFVMIALAIVALLGFANLGTDNFSGFGGSPDTTRRRAPDVTADVPLLQSNEAAQADMYDLREEEWVRTRSYGTNPENSSYGQIPIDKAMEMVIEDGELPRWGQTADTPAGTQTPIETTEPEAVTP